MRDVKTWLSRLSPRDAPWSPYPAADDRAQHLIELAFLSQYTWGMSLHVRAMYSLYSSPNSSSIILSSR